MVVVCTFLLVAVLLCICSTVSPARNTPQCSNMPGNVYGFRAPNKYSSTPVQILAPFCRVNTHHLPKPLPLFCVFCHSASQVILRPMLCQAELMGHSFSM